MNILTTILLILVVILVFNFIIFIHELGHFLAAKWRGMQVDRFQIWFGKPIWKKTVGGVQYGLGTIPLGGFVSLPEMAPMEAIEGKKVEGTGSKKKVTPLDKIIVAIAGPLFSLLLAFAFAIVVWKVGKFELPNTSTEIGYVKENGPADKAGIKVGDVIKEIQGKTPVSFDGKFEAVSTMIALSEGEQIEFKVERHGEILTLNSGYEIPETKWYERSAMRTVGIGGKEKVYVGYIMEHSPASKANLKTGDLILEVNGKPVNAYGAIIDATKDSEKAVTYKVLREGEEPFLVNIAPEFPDLPKDFDRRMIGIGFAPDPKREIITTHPTPMSQIKESANIMYVSISAVISRATSISVDQFSSPLGIGKQMYDLLSIKEGWKELLWFLVILNVNLAILNMFPLPVLDGGHIVFALFEWITGKPMPMKVLEVVQTLFVMLIFSLFLFILMKDIGSQFMPKQGVEFLPDSP